jgi:hypothetical protein
MAEIKVSRHSREATSTPIHWTHRYRRRRQSWSRRWLVSGCHSSLAEEDLRLGKDSLGLDQCHARLYTAIQRHIALVTALAICAVTAASLRDRTDA